MNSSPPDIWSKLDDLIYAWRWVIAIALFGVALLGGGTFLLTHGDEFSTKALTAQSDGGRIPDIEKMATEKPTGPININTASQSEIESLPRIGPTTARRIVEYRQVVGPFRRKEDLMNIKGIGPKTFAELKERIVIK